MNKLKPITHRATLPSMDPRCDTCGAGYQAGVGFYYPHEGGRYCMNGKCSPVVKHREPAEPMHDGKTSREIRQEMNGFYSYGSDEK